MTPTVTPTYRSSAGERAVADAYGRVLAGLPGCFEQLHIDTRHGRTLALAAGDREAPALVLFHGATANALAWADDMPVLARRFRVYAVDTPGEPGGSCPDRILWTGPGVADWVGDTLDGLGAEAAILGGFSQGGYVALRFAAARPDRVRALMLLAPAGVTEVRRSFAAKMVLLERFGPWAGRVSARVRRGWGDHPDAVDLAPLIAAHFCPRVDAMPLLADDELRCLQMPLLLLAGERDAVFRSAESVGRATRVLPNADVRLLPGTGHTIVGAAPMMLEFLERHQLVGAHAPAVGPFRPGAAPTAGPCASPEESVILLAI